MVINTNVKYNFINPSHPAIEPWFLTGFTDGESCFTISIFRSKEFKTGWGVNTIFQIGLHRKDEALLKQIQSFFGVGSIIKHGPESILYRVGSVKDLAVLIKHFDNYPLQNKKQADYFLFRIVVNLINNKVHLTMEGLRKIVVVRASMNWGLSNQLEAAFPNITPAQKPLVRNLPIPDTNWLAGFASAEGSFHVKFLKSKTKLGEAVILCFKLTQHSRDEQLMKRLIEYLDCGNIYRHKELIDFQVTKFSDLINKVIPFFDKFPILGVKYEDFLDFCKIADIMKVKGHLTASGLDQIRIIKAGMNRRRKILCASKDVLK